MFGAFAKILLTKSFNVKYSIILNISIIILIKNLPNEDKKQGYGTTAAKFFRGRRHPARDARTYPNR